MYHGVERALLEYQMIFSFCGRNIDAVIDCHSFVEYLFIYYICTFIHISLCVTP